MSEKKTTGGFIQNSESKRIIKLLKLLRFLGIVRNDTDFASRIHWVPQNLTAAKNGRRDIPELKIMEIEMMFHINHDFIQSGLLPVFKENSEFGKFNNEIQANEYVERIVTEEEAPRKARNEKAKAPVNRSNAKYLGAWDEADQDDEQFVKVGESTYRMKTDLVLERAKAGFLLGFSDPEHAEELPHTEVIVDFLPKGKYLAFEVDGDSMFDGSIASVPHGSIVVGREIKKELWAYKLHSHKYPNWVFVHKREGILVKRIKSQDLDTGKIVLTSLNPDKDRYPDMEFNIDDMYAIYNVVKRELRD